MPDDDSTFDGRLTEHSPAVTYLVITRSRTLYIVEINPDRPTVITRHPVDPRLLFDGEPLPGLQGFMFDAATGLGQILWWKDDPSTRTQSHAMYVGTWRPTNVVELIVQASLAETGPDGPRTQKLIDALKSTLIGLGEGWTPHDLVKVIADATASGDPGHPDIAPGSLRPPEVTGVLPASSTSGSPWTWVA